jgi:hypothetical protein
MKHFKESSSYKRLKTSEAECFGPVGTLAVRNPSQCSRTVLNFTANLKTFSKTVESCLELFFSVAFKHYSNIWKPSGNYMHHLL